jgi:diphosphomevalonate decarboxylase
MVKARARTNIALVKYWGKREAERNLPAAGSISLTLDGLHTDTRVELADEDSFVLNGAPADMTRVVHFLDLVRPAGAPRARVESVNNFPTASGLASSASAFAALALAATGAYGVSMAAPSLSALARRGSGSAARSIFGGFVEMRAEGDDPHAAPLLPEDEWDVRLVIAVVGGGEAKAIGSGDAMTHTARTSPLYAGWLASVPADLAEARAAIAARDLEALGEIAERSALTMHASALAARPGLLYWRGATIEAVHAVRGLRARGVGAWATIDAGPHVKALCGAAEAAEVARTLGAIPGVTDVITARPGAGAEILT